MEDAIRIIEGLDTSNSEENIEAKKMAVAAMKKQIPKKVIKKEYEGEEITGYLCPTCQEVLLHQWDDGFIIGNKKASEEFNRPAYQARKLIRTQGDYLQEDPNE